MTEFPKEFSKSISDVVVYVLISSISLFISSKIAKATGGWRTEGCCFKKKPTVSLGQGIFNEAGKNTETSDLVTEQESPVGSRKVSLEENAQVDKISSDEKQTKRYSSLRRDRKVSGGEDLEKELRDLFIANYRIYYYVFLFSSVFFYVLTLKYTVDIHIWKKIMSCALIVYISVFYYLWTFLDFLFFGITKKMSHGRTRTIYTIVVLCFLYYAFYSRIQTSSSKLNWTLDTYYNHRKPYDSENPPVVLEDAVELDKIEPNGTCTWKVPKMSWHFMIDGLFKPVYWFDEACDQPSMNSNKDTTIYRAAMERDQKQIIAFDNIDNKKYPDVYTRKITKAVSTLQKTLLDRVHGVTEREMNEGTEEIFLDFRGENEELGKLLIKVKDRRKEYPELKKKLLKVDPATGKYNVLNLFVDTISRGRFFRRFPQTIQFLTNLKNKEGSSARVNEFNKFHSLRGFSFANMLASHFGLQEDQWREEKYDTQKRVEHFAHDDGYITGFSSDICQYSEQNTENWHDFFEKSFDDTFQ
jgi:hypothetical protein